MKFIVSSTALLKHLQLLSGVLNTSNTLPILDNFLFETSDNKLTLTASDLETTMTVTMEVEARDEGLIAIPAKKLLDALKTFPEQPLSFSVDSKTFAIDISSDVGKYRLTGQNGHEFPKNPSIEDPTEVNLNADILAEAIHTTLFAAGNDDLRPVMSGMFFELSKDHVRFVATDAHKLVRYTRTDAQAQSEASFIMPKKPLNLLKNILSSTDAEVKISFNQTNAGFTFDNVTLISRLIDGKYPNYEAVIPKENPNVMTIDRGSFLNSVRRVAIFSNKTTHQVRFRISGSELNISAEDRDYENEANERLTCSYEGDDMEIGFNSKFLLDMLNNIEADEVSLELSAPNRAGIIIPQGTDENTDVLMLVMPVMLNS
ncbi:MAG: DNA polymerase III subunit beta [Cryomorphaceae bacterium]|nr:MAG: DNA polymerase III subunit beta [Cryomorphaceae bacterium]